MSAKWGIFGKSFNDFVEASNKRKIAIDNLFTINGLPLKDAKKQAGSFWSYLYPSKESIQSQLIDIDTLYPDIDNVQASEILKRLQNEQVLVNANKRTWQDYFNGLKEGEKWQIEFVQNTDLQKASLDDVKKGYENARQSAIAHNAELKQQTLSAKAASVAMKALTTVLNMAVSYAITKLITAWDDYKEKLREVAQETAEQAEKSSNHVQSLLDLKEQLDEGTTSAEDLTIAFREQMRTMGYTEEEIDNLIDKYNGLSGAIKGATEEALNNAKTDAYADMSTSGRSLTVEAKGNTNVGTYYSQNKELSKEIRKMLDESTAILDGGVYRMDKNASADDIYSYYLTLKDISQLIQETAKETGDDSLLAGDSMNPTPYYQVSEALDALSESAELYGDAINRLHNADAQLELSNYLKTNDIDSKEAFDTYVDGIKNNTTYSEAYRQVLLEVANDAFPQFSAAAKDASDSMSDFNNKIDTTSILSNIQSLSDGLDQLDKIYADVKDGEYFDFSSILNNDDFTEAFGGLGESYENFIQTVTNSPDDINACQQAFNDLATAYIYNSGKLDDLTEETKASTIEMLKQMGVANAEEIVKKQLASNTKVLADAEENLNNIKESGITVSKELENCTLSELSALIKQAEEAGINCDALYAYMQQKIACNKVTIATNGDTEALASLCKGLNVASEAVVKFYKLKSQLKQLDAEGNNANAQVKTYLEYQISQLQSEMQQAVTDAYNVNYRNTVTYNGGSTTNKGNSGSQSEKEFNWIETLLSRIQNKISDLGKTASATWKSWTERNSALKDQISAVNQEISLQQQAISKYESLANSLGLSSYYQNLVKNGALDVSTITDSDLADKISKYQEYWEKIVSAEDAIQDLEDELRNLARTEFDNIAKQFDSEISLVEANISTLEAYIEQTEMKGNLVSKNYYSAMYAEEEKNLSYLQQKYEQLSNKLSDGSIAQGTEEFNEMSVEIKEVKQAIIESTTALEEYIKTMRELDWEVFDLGQEKIGNLVTESENLIKLLSYSDLYNNDGSITSEGQATLGLHAVNYSTYTAQVKDYADEIAKLDAQFANDSLDKNYLERREELVALQWECILAAKEEQESIKELWSDSYSTLLDYMQEVIDKRLELLQTTKDLYDYEKQVTEQTEEIARLQNILNSYKGDTSEEAKASIQKYTVELQEAQEALEETEYERYLSDMEQMYNAMMDDAEEWQNARLDDISGLLQDIIDSTDANASTIAETLKTEVEKAGGSLSESMQSIWSGTDGVEGSVVNVNNTLLDIKALVQSMVKDSDTEASNNTSNATASVTPTTTPVTTPSTSSTTNNSSTTAKAITVGGMINASGALIYTSAGSTKGLSQFYKNDPIYTVLSEKNNYLKVRHHSLSSGTTGWFKKSDVKAYKTGGLVDETGLAWLDGTKGKPEMVLSAKDTENFIMLRDSLSKVAQTNMFDAIQNYAKLPNFVPNATNNNQQAMVIQGDIVLEGVQSPEDLARQLNEIYSNDIGNVRKVIKTDVYGGMLGKNSYEHRKYM